MKIIEFSHKRLSFMILRHQETPKLFCVTIDRFSIYNLRDLSNFITFPSISGVCILDLTPTPVRKGCHLIFELEKKSFFFNYVRISPEINW